MQQEEPYQGAIYQECSIINPIVASTTECETLTLFLNYQSTIFVRTTTKELGHPQPATSTRVENETTNNCICNNLQQKKSKSFDIRLHWLRDQINNSQFEMHWMKGDFNYVEYYSKNNAESHNKQVRSKCLVLQTTTHYMKVGCFTPRKKSASMTVHSQQPLSDTRVALLKHGL